MVVLAALFTSTCKANDVINAAPISASEKYYVGADSMSLLHKLSSGLTNKNFNATEDRGSRQTPSVVIDLLHRAWINDEWLQQRLWNLSLSLSLFVRIPDAWTPFSIARLQTLWRRSENAQHRALLASWIGFSGRRYGSYNRRHCRCHRHLHLHHHHLARHLQYEQYDFLLTF